MKIVLRFRASVVGALWLLAWGHVAVAASSSSLSNTVLCQPETAPCLNIPLSRPIMGGSIIPADFITSDTGLLSKLGRSFVVTIPANSDAPVDVGGMKLSPRQLDPSGKGGTFVFTYKSQKKDAKGNTRVQLQRGKKVTVQNHPIRPPPGGLFVGPCRGCSAACQSNGQVTPPLLCSSHQTKHHTGGAMDDKQTQTTLFPVSAPSRVPTVHLHPPLAGHARTTHPLPRRATGMFPESAGTAGTPGTEQQFSLRPEVNSTPRTSRDPPTRHPSEARPSPLAFRTRRPSCPSTPPC